MVAIRVRDEDLAEASSTNQFHDLLYPIRVEDYGEFTAVNYHRWDICRHACGHGEPLYIYLKEPLIRRFGQEWYDELIEQINPRDTNG